MSISAKVIEDSTSQYARRNHRLTTFQLRYPRMVHAELMTHRAFSRNSSSSRAIPVERMIQWVKDDPAKPVEWGRNQRGMQAETLLSPEDAAKAAFIWLQARDDMIRRTEEMLALGVHKQIANRLLEPWHHISVIVTASQFANWFALRWHKLAQPEIRELARAMAKAYIRSEPRPLKPGEWHLPYVSAEERAAYDTPTCRKFSVARCARVSLLNHDGTNPDAAKDIALHDMLAVAEPLHASPAEHQATPMDKHQLTQLSNLGGNFGIGWVQYRKTLANECVEVLPWVRDPGLLADL
jgi:hypothetical protein